MSPNRVQAALREAAALAGAGRHDQAASVLAAVVAVHPGDAGLRYRLAEALVASDRPDEAIRELQHLAEGPAPVQPLRLLGGLLYRAGRFSEARAVFERLLELRPRMGEAVDGLAKSLMGQGDPKRAIEAIRAFGETGASDAGLLLTLARAHYKARDPESGVRVLEPLARTGSAAPEVWSVLAQLHERLRQTDEARRCAETALAADHRQEVAARVLARLDRASGRLEEARSRLETLQAMELPDEARAHVCMELGQVLDEFGAHAAAMSMFAQGHERLAAANPTLRGEFDDYLARIDRAAASPKEVDASEWPTVPPDDGLPAPVFLVGFPRSGTTLFERVLEGLPGATTSDEAPMLVETINRRLGSGRADLARIHSFAQNIDESEWRALRASYWRLAGECVGASPGAGTLIDKHPMNTPYLSFIRRVFPDARVVTILRDPRDVVLSAYMQDMVPARSMLHFRSLEATARMYDAMMRLYAVDRERLGLSIHETRYEELLSDPGNTARSLVEFLGHSWHEDLLEFAARSRERSTGVNPYSTSKALFHTSHGRWRRYQEWIAPIARHLREHIQNFGYPE